MKNIDLAIKTWSQGPHSMLEVFRIDPNAEHVEETKARYWDELENLPDGWYHPEPGSADDLNCHNDDAVRFMYFSNMGILNSGIRRHGPHPTKTAARQHYHKMKSIQSAPAKEGWAEERAAQLSNEPSSADLVVLVRTAESVDAIVNERKDSIDHLFVDQSRLILLLARAVEALERRLSNSCKPHKAVLLGLKGGENNRNT